LTALTRIATALRVLSAAALVVILGTLPVRMVTAAFDPFQPYPGHTVDYGFVRPRAIRAALPAIADRPEETVLVLGSSGVARAFVPSVFDTALAGSGKHYVSFNLAQYLLQPETTLAMAKVIRQTYEERNKRIGLLIFGISVPELARDNIRAARRSMPDQPFAFSRWEDLRDRAHVDPTGALGDGLDLFFFGNVRPERARLWLDDRIAARPVGCFSGLKQPVEGAEALGALTSFCDELHTQFPRGIPPWNPSTRGGIDFGMPSTRPMLERLVELQPSSVSSPPAPAVRPTKAPNDLDEDAIRTVIAALRELETVSKDTFVLRDMLNPALLSSLAPAHVAQWRDVAERIAREGGATLLDLNDGTFPASDFGDRTHLNPLAAERFSSVLASRVRPMVRQNHASR
jgi:hypothetical protein